MTPPLRIANALRAQWVYAGLVALWQVLGVVLVGLGRRPPGLSPSLATAAIAMAFGVAFSLTAPRWPRVFAVLSLVTGTAAALTIRGAFINDPMLWPSDGARYAGVAINLVGVIATAWSIAAVVEQRSRLSD